MTQLNPLQLVTRIVKKINDITCNEDCLQFDADNARMLCHVLYQSAQLLVQLDRSASTGFSRLTRFREVSSRMLNGSGKMNSGTSSSSFAAEVNNDSSSSVSSIVFRPIRWDILCRSSQPHTYKTNSNSNSEITFFSSGRNKPSRKTHEARASNLHILLLCFFWTPAPVSYDCSIIAPEKCQLCIVTLSSRQTLTILNSVI
jgi:hypothetical protein